MVASPPHITRHHLFELRKDLLIAIAGAVWLIVGVNIDRMGIERLLRPGDTLTVYLIGGTVVFVLFSLMFTNLVRKHTVRILTLPGTYAPIWQFFDLKSYLIMAFMMTLGITLRSIPTIPPHILGGFYIGVGSGLAYAGVRFLINWVRQLHANRQGIDPLALFSVAAKAEPED